MVITRRRVSRTRWDMGQGYGTEAEGGRLKVEGGTAMRASAARRPALSPGMLPVLLLALGALLALPLTAVGLPGTWAFIAGACLWKTFD